MIGVHRILAACYVMLADWQFLIRNKNQLGLIMPSYCSQRHAQNTNRLMDYQFYHLFHEIHYSMGKSWQSNVHHSAPSTMTGEPHYLNELRMTTNYSNQMDIDTWVDRMRLVGRAAAMSAEILHSFTCGHCFCYLSNTECADRVRKLVNGNSRSLFSRQFVRFWK